MSRLRLILGGFFFFVGLLLGIHASVAMSVPFFVISANLFLWGDLYKMLWITFAGILFVTLFYFQVFEILGELFDIILN